MTAPPRRSARPSVGSQAFARLVGQLSAAGCARVLDISEAMVRAIAKGDRAPGPELQAKLREHGIDLGAWASPTEAPAATSEGTLAGERPADAAPPDVDQRKRLLALLAVLYPIIAEANAAGASHRTVATIANAAVGAERQLARLDAAAELSEAKILASDAWARLQKTLLDILAAHPAALADIVHAMGRMRDPAEGP